jgi:putative phosphoesterase
MKKIKRVGAIGDIHAEDELLHKTLQFLNNQGLDVIVSVGDIADGSGNVNACCDRLKAEKVITVAGNHDIWLLCNQIRGIPEATQLSELSKSSRFFLELLPKTRQLETVAGLLLLCHGINENDMAHLTPYDYGDALEQESELQQLIHENRYRFIINGHTHYKMVRQFGQLRIINAGTLKWAHGSGFAVVDFEKRYVQFYEFYCQGDAIGKAEYISW